MNNEIDDRTKQLIGRHLAGETSAEEEQLLVDWINRSSENTKAYNDFKNIMLASTREFTGRPSVSVDVDREWALFQDAIGDRENVRTLSTSWWLKIAASIIFVAVAGYTVFYFINRERIEMISSGDSIKTIILPDGSQITLNRKSHISYASHFNKGDRKVTLSGEAFFDVKRDESRPFVIEAKQARIEVLGTSFNVAAYDSIRDVEVIVKTGKVRVSLKNLEKHADITPGEKATVGAASQDIVQEVNRDANYNAWQTLELTFNEEPLKKVVETLNATYGSHIKLTGTISESCVVTVSFHHQTLESVLNVLESTLNLTIKRDGNRIEITAPGC